MKEALAASGHWHVRGVVVAALDGDGQPTGAMQTIDCDVVCMSTGYAPNAPLIYHGGGKLVYEAAKGDVK